MRFHPTLFRRRHVWRRLCAAAAGAGVLGFTAPPTLALPKIDGPRVLLDEFERVIECPDFLEPTVELIRYAPVQGYPIVGFSVKVWAEAVKFHGRPNLPCGFPEFVAPLPAFRWSLESRPAGSSAQLADVAGLAPRLALDTPGPYLVRLTVCPEGCTIEPPGSHLSPVEVEPQVMDVPIVALESAPLGPETAPAVAPSASAGLSPPPGGCGLGAGAIARQWWAVRQIEGPDDYRLVEGLVRASRVSRKDSPLNHDSQDVTFHIEPDPKYSDVFFDDGSPVPEAIEVEWERTSIPERYRPTAGDRASVFGYWVTDCGHDRPEVHPPVGIAVHRPRPIRVPDGHTFPELGGQSAGTGIYVPGVISDVFFTIDGGDLVECGTSTGLANAEPRPLPGGGFGPACVPAPSLRRTFEFDVYLPRNPQVTMREAGFDAPPAPLYVQSDPIAGPAPEIEVRTDESGLFTYLHVTIDLRNYNGPTYAHRIAAGWVLPAPDNWGLGRYKLRFVRLNVHDDGDGTGRGDGDWRLWVNTNNASNEDLGRQEWTQVVNYDVHGIEDFGGRPWETGRPGEPGAPAADRSLGPDLLRYPSAAPQPVPRPRDYGIAFHTTGYEADTLTDDDAGTVYRARVEPSTTFALANVCQPSEQALGLLYSGCVRYTAVFEAVPGAALPPAVLSAAGRRLADQYVLRCRGASCRGVVVEDLVAPPLEATAVDPRDVLLSSRSGPVELDRFAPFETGRREATSLTEVSIADFDRDVRQAQKTDRVGLRAVMARLRAFFDARLASPATRAEALLDAQVLKAALPPELWARHFRGLPAPRPGPGVSRARFTGAATVAVTGASVRLASLDLNCSRLRPGSTLVLTSGRSRFVLDLVLDAECSAPLGRSGGAVTLRGIGVGRLDGRPGALVEWTLVDGGSRRGSDAASLTVRRGEDLSIVLEASGPVVRGDLRHHPSGAS
jgi:hypothetical protein